MTYTEQTVGHAAVTMAGRADETALATYLYSRAQSVMGGTSQIQRNLIAHSNPGTAHFMTTYNVPHEIQIEEDGPIRIIRLNRPDELNATNPRAARRARRFVPTTRRRP